MTDCLYAKPDYQPGKCCHCVRCDYMIRRIMAKTVIPKAIYDGPQFIRSMREMNFIEYRLRRGW